MLPWWQQYLFVDYGPKCHSVLILIGKELLSSLIGVFASQPFCDPVGDVRMTLKSEIRDWLTKNSRLRNPCYLEAPTDLSVCCESPRCCWRRRVNERVIGLKNMNSKKKLLRKSIRLPFVTTIWHLWEIGCNGTETERNFNDRAIWSDGLSYRRIMPGSSVLSGKPPSDAPDGYLDSASGGLMLLTHTSWWLAAPLPLSE